MDKATAMTMKVNVRKRMCPECGHMHKWNTYCHHFTEGFMDEDDEDGAENCSGEVRLRLQLLGNEKDILEDMIDAYE